MKRIRLVIFDLDGTLVDAYQAIIRSFNYTMKRLGYPGQSALTIRRAVGWGDKRLLAPFIKTKDLNKALSIYRRHHRRALLKGSRMLPGAKALLSYLRKAGYRLAVASNRPTEFSRIIIRHLGLERYLDYVLCGDKLKHMKPHPEILNRIMERFKVKPPQAIFVGDMAVDARAGKRAKVRSVIVTTGSGTRQETAKERPYRIISRLAELRRLI